MMAHHNEEVKAVLSETPLRTTGAATSTAALRRANQDSVLRHLWGVATSTAADLMQGTALSRATVHDVCADLVERGWVVELDDARQNGSYRRGRPARRYALDGRAGLLVGVDAGAHTCKALVTDLRGEVLADARSPLGAEAQSGPERLAVVMSTTEQALHRARATPQPSRSAAGAAPVVVISVGVPAPVDAMGRTRPGYNSFWDRMNPDLAGHLRAAHGCQALTENDANLAALAEGWVGAAQGCPNQVTLLTGERLGAGIVADGRLVRGRLGRGGEMRYLDLLNGVGSVLGIAHLVREWASETASGARADEGSPARPAGLDPCEILDAARVDPVAGLVVDRITQRLARVVATLAGLLDPEVVILSGAVMTGHQALADAVSAALAEHLDPPLPAVRASSLGGDVVALGAVREAMVHARNHALDIDLLGAPAVATAGEPA